MANVRCRWGSNHPGIEVVVAAMVNDLLEYRYCSVLLASVEWFRPCEYSIIICYHQWKAIERPVLLWVINIKAIFFIGLAQTAAAHTAVTDGSAPW